MAQAASGFNPVTEGMQIVYDNCHWVAAAWSDGEVVLANSLATLSRRLCRRSWSNCTRTSSQLMAAWKCALWNARSSQMDQTVECSLQHSCSNGLWRLFRPTWTWNSTSVECVRILYPALNYNKSVVFREWRPQGARNAVKCGTASYEHCVRYDVLGPAVNYFTAWRVCLHCLCFSSCCMLCICNRHIQVFKWLMYCKTSKLCKFNNVFAFSRDCFVIRLICSENLITLWTFK